VTTGEIPNPVNSTNSGEGRPPVSGQDQFSVRYSPYNVDSSNPAPAARVRLSLSGIDNDQSLAFGNTITLRRRSTKREPSFMAIWKAPPRSDRPGRQHRRHSGRLGSPRRLNKMFEVVDNLLHRRVHALRWRGLLYNSDTITYPRSIRGVHVLVARKFPDGVYNNSASRRRSARR
jgi:hypothetical protein